MAIKFKYPWIGVAIPCFLISFIGYTAHYFILSNYLPLYQQVVYQLCMSMIWISYYLAIIVNPGSPSKNFKPPKHEWKNFCKKCNMYKPPRAHHCKTCGQCVLVMDHHCPWTMNCIGYNNFPHFMRFLFWVVISIGYLLTLMVKRSIYLWNIRHLPGYFIKKSELWFLAILFQMSGFVFLTILLLFARCIKNQVFKGMSQIEVWEMDRIESLYYRKMLMPKLLKNLQVIYKDTSIKYESEEVKYLIKNSLRMNMFEYINFPYDINPWSNAIEFLGPIYIWLSPVGVPNGDGMHFKKNDLSAYEATSSICDKLLSLPWPPDGNATIAETAAVDGFELFESAHNQEEDDEPVNKRGNNNNSNARKNWENSWGENLAGFGVDTEEE
ncbi:palmitoyltransferase PFA4 SCDLUD_000935 [Saccharomycodes ludwigii]|uniref:palmitoyltransferase PFA4 n=1 Tax=Saccharomycodes ludwigii TaxID=36035 RepID=UPI001E873C43|nr:hypothetical protein SCDLUD_000935 [Saccharomycodes ludwigii]KAH3903310.1 hypothetical protein SCDLUD_000935 [Saccharomycodes ludwigii]